ncbi:hypothetical protein HNY73_004585 [Argiope bruennichi]|uniref:Uncharacterized protein n=1 Tax=Argiope bruennichi TaxID=94029 RepID=A0A8T0FQG4_ARGBR|nr:hypothetical protein HNY73_004585 [Argiope bruennichi]
MFSSFESCLQASGKGLGRQVWRYVQHRLGLGRTDGLLQKIHAAVLPSKENCPPDYDTEDECPEYFIDPSVKFRTFCKDSGKLELSEDGLLQRERLDSNDRNRDGETSFNEMADKKSIVSPGSIESDDDEGSDENLDQCDDETKKGWIACSNMKDAELDNAKWNAKLIEKTFFNEMTDNSSDSSVIEESSDDESLADDSVYWDFVAMSRADPKDIPSSKYDIPISDNEDIEELEKCVTKPNFSEWEIGLLEEDVESIKKEICDEKNEKLDNLSQKRVRPEDITDGEIFQNFIDMFDGSNNDGCPLFCPTSSRSGFYLEAHKGSNPVLCVELENAEGLKCLDLFLSTVVVFSDAFFSETKQSFIEFLGQPSLSKRSFIEYLKPRALLLTEKNGHFDLILTCTYFSRVIMTRAYSHSCFHFARAACKLLTRILEGRFGRIFETESGWEKLISYCRKIHVAVFPSQKNRPPGYEPYPNIDSGNDEVLNETGRKKTELDDESENKILEQKEHHNCNEIKTNFLDELRRLLPTTESSYLCGFKAAPDRRSRVDDPNYCGYFTMECSTLCKKITDSQTHLDNVYNLLRKLEGNIDAKCISSARYDISISDDEYIEQLQRDERSNFYPEQKIVISYEVKDCFAKEICENENKRLRANSSQYRISPGDITYEEVIQYISNSCAEEDDNPKCKLCYGKMYTFINNWKKSFHEKYSNSDIVTDVI